ncbi:MAG: TauD/TfdA family dioxygenase [Betaproteobacteria bacterium]|nr:TauD/TfdA family dioxygenase [Betaproteobacteria bacterium]
MGIRFKPLHPHVGAEVEGFDFRNPIDADTRRSLLEGFGRHRVLVVRGQDLEPEHQQRFSEVFGVVAYRGNHKSADGKESPIMQQHVSNNRPDGIIGLGELSFHNDQVHFEEPNCACTLYAIEVPAEGGDTLFANTGVVFESLPEAMQRKLKPLTALHVYDFTSSYNARMPGALAPPGSPCHVQPVVWAEPSTGKHGIWINRVTMQKINEVSAEESDQLVDDLFARIEDPAVYYRHRWQPRDLVLWNNFMTLHRREDFDPKAPRTLRRMPILWREEDRIAARQHAH